MKVPSLVKLGVSVNIQGALVAEVSTALGTVKLSKAGQVLVNLKFHLLLKLGFLGDIILNLIHISGSALCVDTLLVLLVLPRPSSAVSNSAHCAVEIRE